MSGCVACAYVWWERLCSRPVTSGCNGARAVQRGQSRSHTLRPTAWISFLKPRLISGLSGFELIQGHMCTAWNPKNQGCVYVQKACHICTGSAEVMVKLLFAN